MLTIANAARLPVAAARKNVKKSPPTDNLNTPEQHNQWRGLETV
jgi:hypothetical protein